MAGLPEPVRVRHPLTERRKAEENLLFFFEKNKKIEENLFFSPGEQDIWKFDPSISVADRSLDAGVNYDMYAQRSKLAKAEGSSAG